ncbi:AI-2E family transporter [Liquorilactobacillus satsumensis]|nr:AI-2E family transporter [Liquorilactobacillus satsumensis]MCC7666373.1 AI-2E family transporter [Liquorilactobacillus satsumensis]MCP9313094.1 AI-2E family transporter [Liquorilactobacillus satsumensis]MCP9328025.1 AI-2E family transporter [Liquorilactobacillus satsumensis]MCP9358339.1 AI-2E family transporter [Liquorilactobacillus satsumensis]MCP9359278.1 AI-2E family transporter [Liquorilactobacillus satsumensis]
MDKESRWIRFLGGRNLVFTLLVLGMLGAVIFLYSKVDFIFKPLTMTLTIILPPVIFGLILFYLINPLVVRLERFLKRTWIITVIYLLILGLLVFGGIELIIAARTQTLDLVRHLPQIMRGFQRNVDHLTATLPYTKELEQMLSDVDLSGMKISSFAQKYFQSGVHGFSGVFSALSTMLLTIVVGPIIAFFLLRDKEKFFTSVRRLVPPVFRRDFTEFGKIVDQQIGGYLKGQIIASAILGLLYWPSFLLIGLHYSGVLALAAGILSIVPYVGSFAAFLPGLIIAFQGSLWLAVKFTLVWFIIQFLHGQLVVPRIMGDNLQLHMITVLLVLLVMGDLLGLVGVVFGIPIYCFIKAFSIYLFRHFKQRYNRFYGGKGRYEETEFSKEEYLKK